jgi:predicted transcriptional regulator of viral defense system
MDFLTLSRSIERHGFEIFTLNDVVKLTGQNKDVIISTLSRWVKQGKVFRLKNQYYSLRTIETKFLFQKLFLGSYIGLHSALEYYGSTTQRFNNLDLIVKKVLNDQEIANVLVTFHSIRKNLFFGYKKVLLGNTDVFISNIEKTLIDCTIFSSKVYLAETDSFIAAFKDKINLELLALYLNKLHSSVLNKRIGYLLERNHIIIDNSHINRKYERLNPMLGDSGPKEKKWKLIINEDF